MDEKIIPSKQTRLQWLLILSAIATMAWVFTLMGWIDGTDAITFTMWSEFEKWLFISYGASEVGSKYSHAVMNK